MRALMAGHTEERNRGGSIRKHVFRPVIPALPLRPVEKRTTSDKKAQESVQGKNKIQNGAYEHLKSGGWSTPEQEIKLQFGEVEGDHEQAVHTLETAFSAGVATPPLPSPVFAPRHKGKSTPLCFPPNASNNDTSMQDASSRPSSASPSLKFPSPGPSRPPRQTLQKAAVELPADASLSCFSSLNISFLYLEDPDSASPPSTLYSGSPIVTPRTTSQEPTPPEILDQALEQGSFPTLHPGDNRLDLEGKQPATYPVEHLDRANPAKMNPLVDHLVRLYDQQIGCDQQIMVDIPCTPPFSHRIEAHKAIVSRSAVLATIINGNLVRGYGDESIRIAWSSKNYFNPHAFSMSLRYLYSDKVLGIDDIERFTWLRAHQHIHCWRKSQLSYTITYWLTGLMLRTVEVERQAEQIAIGLINWDTIGYALAAATDLCDQPDLIEEPEEAPLLINGPVHPDEIPIAHVDPVGQRQKMLQMAVAVGKALKAMIHSFWTKKVNFQGFHLDTTLEQTVINPLFPLTRECIDYYRPRIAVETIQFGQFPIQPQAPEQVRYLSQADRIISNMMLNLPLADLKKAVNILKAEGAQRGVAGLLVKNFVKAALAEREIKRRIVLNSRSVGREARLAGGTVWEAVGYKESVLEGELPDQWEVVAEWEGFL